MKEVAVGIPIYRTAITHNERIALEQARRIFHQYDIYFIMPYGLEVDYGCPEIKKARFAPEHFKSNRSYSDFMLKQDVYTFFIEYEFLLIYQLDAFVFRDELSYFCELGYDYIGAPTLEGMFKFYREEQVLFTQNGGFSLRRIKPFIRWIEDNEKEIAFMKNFDLEDSIIYALRKKGLRYAPVDAALAFSYDSNVEECFDRTNGRLPFGCHAWERYAYERWKPYIEACGYCAKPPEPGNRIIKNYYKIAEDNRKWIEKFHAGLFRKIVSRHISAFKDSIDVFGMGKRGYEAMQLLFASEIKINRFADNNPDVVERGMYPVRAVLGSQLFMDGDTQPVIVAMDHHVDVCIWLEQNGYRHNRDYATYAEIYADLEREITS